MSIEKLSFGKLNNKKEIELYKITNKNGMELSLITYGATIQSIMLPDGSGKKEDVTVGFDDIDGHVNFSDFEGNTVGRCCNRICGGKFSLNSKEYNVTKNEKGITCLHGGAEFSKAVWDADVLSNSSVMMSYTSEDGAQGFPGKMKTTVTFTLNDLNEVIIEYTAVCDKDCPVNLTNHTYFNLTGNMKKDILNHILCIDADNFTPIDENSIPTGEIASVYNSPFNFNCPHEIGENINENDEQLILARGYDHNFCINKPVKADLPVITVKEPDSGRVMCVYTDMPGVQFYTGNFLDGSITGKGGKKLIKHAGFCLETQFYPDTPNHADFPQCTLKAGKKFNSYTKYCFDF